MRFHQSLALLVALVASTNLVHGQSLLNKLEQQLPGPAGGTTKATAPVPGTGHLGAIPFDDDPMYRGVRVKEVRPGGPADLGGLRSGDLITTVDAQPIAKLADLDVILDKSVPNQRLRVLVDRAGKQQSLNIMLGVKPEPPPALEPAPTEAPTNPAPTLTLPGSTPTPAAASDPLLAPPSSTPLNPARPGLSTPPASSAPPLVPTEPAPSVTLESPAPIRSRPSTPATSPIEPAPAEERSLSPADALPSPAPSGGGGASLGVSVLPLTDEARATYGLTVRRGAFIAGLRPGSPAERAGLPIGGVIVALNGRRIDSADDLVAFISTAQPGAEVELAYYEGARLTRKTVRLAPASPPASSSTTSPLATPAPRSGPLGLGGGLGGPDRPLLNRVERMVEGLNLPRAPSTVYNPADMAALQARMQEISDQLRAMDDRLRALEGKSGSAPPSSSSPFAPPATVP